MKVNQIDECIFTDYLTNTFQPHGPTDTKEIPEITSEADTAIKPITLAEISAKRKLPVMI